MKNITYNIENNDYNTQIEKTTNIIIKNSNNYIQFLNDYVEYVNQHIQKSGMECILDIVSIGIYWMEYIQKAYTLDNTSKNILIKLAKIRRNNTQIKEDIDYIKGHIITEKLTKNTKKEIPFTTTSIDKLFDYLSATGEYYFELKELNYFKEYLKTKNKTEIEKILKQVLNFSDYFKTITNKTLHKYTYNVNNYLEQELYKHKNKEDLIFCGRREVEYHLNMFGAEIMNRAYRKEYDKREKTIILLPDCMQIKNKKCLSQETIYGQQCIGCSDNCNVNQLKNYIEKEVYVIKHESELFKDIPTHEKKTISIIGIACVLNLINGGLKAKSLGMPAQCVILNYVGCSNHWMQNRISTSINSEKLKEIIG